MDVNINSIVDHGHNSERIILDVVTDTDIGKYMVLDTTYTASGSVSNKVRHPYWFPDQPVKKGDTIILYTKRGSGGSVKDANGSVTYSYYWGLDSNIWNDDGDYALLMYIGKWQSHKVQKKK